MADHQPWLREEIIEDQQHRPEPVEDVPRSPEPGEPPVPGAQWDEVHRRWERWDDAGQAWVVVGDGGDGIDPSDENPLPPLLARELQHAEELEAAETEDPVVPGVEAVPEPSEHPRGAQWNEVAGRWERFDAASGAWVPAEE